MVAEGILKHQEFRVERDRRVVENAKPRAFKQVGLQWPL
jgi:hypothetical protein